MKLLTCEMCGSTDVVKQDGLFVCQSCGCKYSVEEARKIMLEGSVDVSGSKVLIDESEKQSNLYILARRARDNNDYEHAITYYEEIVLREPNSWEALFYSLYFRALNAKSTGDTVVAIRNISNAINMLFELMDTLENADKNSVLNEIKDRILGLSKSMIQISTKYVNGQTPYDTAKQLGTEVIKLEEKVGDNICKVLTDKTAAVSLYEDAIHNYKILKELSVLTPNWKEIIEKKIVSIEPAYQQTVDKDIRDNRIKKLEEEKHRLKEQQKKISVPAYIIAQIFTTIFLVLTLLGSILIVRSGESMGIFSWIIMIISLLFFGSMWMVGYVALKNRHDIDKRLAEINNEIVQLK